MKKQELIQKFAVEGNVVNIREYGNGHINRTELVETEQDGRKKRYIFQQINTDVFKDVDSLMENITGITSYLRKCIERQGGDPDR